MIEQAPDDTGKGKNRNTGTEESGLEVSDWVTFLSNEKQGNISSFLSWTAVLMALIAVTISITFVTEGRGWEKTLGFVSILVALFCAWLMGGKLFYRRYTDALKTLNKIMSGDLTQEKAIRKEWERVQLTKEHEGKHWHGGGGASFAGALWFAGWLFTIAYANLVWWKIILGLVVWPYYLGLAVR